MKKLTRMIPVIAAVLAATMVFTSCGKKEEAPQNAQAATGEENGAAKGELKVGLECGYPPFNWTQITDDNGGVPISGNKEFAGGYDVEIAKKLAEGLGRELVIVKTEWDGLIPALESGMIDVIVAGMSPT